MSCTLLTLAACLSLGGLYVDAGSQVLMHQHQAAESFTLKQTDVEIRPSGLAARYYYLGHSFDREVSNPYGSLAIGYEIDAGALRANASIYHQSSIAVHDHGDTGISLNVRWFPFGH